MSTRRFLSTVLVLGTLFGSSAAAQQASSEGPRVEREQARARGPVRERKRARIRARIHARFERRQERRERSGAPGHERPHGKRAGALKDRIHERLEQRRGHGERLGGDPRRRAECVERLREALRRRRSI